MKFELTEPNQQYSRSELLQDLKDVAKQLGKNSLKQREYDLYGKYSYQTMKKRFGSWLKALEVAGLEQGKRPWGGNLTETRIPEKMLIDDMQRVAQELNKKAIRISDYEEYGKFGTATIIKRFGGWNKAKEKANLEIGRRYNSTEEDYFKNILHVWETLGRQPKYQEMTMPLSKLHISSYENKFGTWRNALESFIEYINSKDEYYSNDEINETEEKNDFDKIVTPKQKERTKHKIPKRTNRIANLRQRFRIMKRDGFKCVLCGASPAINPGCELHIDHIIPWSKGGETVEENLRTLCFKCNLGRSNKE